MKPFKLSNVCALHLIKIAEDRCYPGRPQLIPETLIFVRFSNDKKKSAVLNGEPKPVAICKPFPDGDAIVQGCGYGVNTQDCFDASYNFFIYF